MRTTRHHHVGAVVSQLRKRLKGVTEQALNNFVCFAHYKRIAGLGDVLCCCTPVHPAAIWLTNSVAELMHECHKRVTRFERTFMNMLDIKFVERGCLVNRESGLERHNTDFCLSERKRCFNV